MTRLEWLVREHQLLNAHIASKRKARALARTTSAPAIVQSLAEWRQRQVRRREAPRGR